MKKILLITLIFILQSIPSFGNSIDGKGLICENVDTVMIIGFLFDNGRVYGNKFVNKRDIIEIENFSPQNNEYSTTDNTIEWWKVGESYTFSLNRKTLVLETLNLDNLSQKTYETTHQCNVYDDFDIFWEIFHSVKEDLQNFYDEKMKDNKI